MPSDPDRCGEAFPIGVEAESCQGRSWWKAEFRDRSFLAAVNIERNENPHSTRSVPNCVHHRTVQRKPERHRRWPAERSLGLAIGG